MIDTIQKDAADKMQHAVDFVREDMATIRTGRAHPAMFNKINAEYYGAPTPLQQLAQFTSPDPRSLLITPFDRSAIGAIEKAIRDSDLGLNPASQGEIIRVPMPALTEERRKELIKVVKHEGEGAKVAVRNLRRDANAHLKDALKAKTISEDEERRAQDDVQKLTDKAIVEIDKVLAQKEQELMQI